MYLYTIWVLSEDLYTKKLIPILTEKEYMRVQNSTEYQKIKGESLCSRKEKLKA